MVDVYYWSKWLDDWKHLDRMTYQQWKENEKRIRRIFAVVEVMGW